MEERIIPIYHKVELLKPCPFCGYPAELNQYTIDCGYDRQYIRVLVCCTNSGKDSEDKEECPLYIPAHGFYQRSIEDAICAWNRRS